ncbi:MAG: hypothetical protein Q4E11_01235 [Corynebacterium sp.]|uniref:hypothetical protein n=1 Tax=Corynebacterium sp. TaxID=1720 RepID=UPI0026DCD907|nr:hypothetical protein [Corynebacterium sp.]MDO5029191.1 hypothetical protein [Corynebacterium sp.]
MSAKSGKGPEVSLATEGYGPDGIDGAAVGRGVGVAALLTGVIGILFSWVLVGGIVGVVAVVLGIVAMVKSQGAKKRIADAGRMPRTSGVFGLGIVGIITGLVAVAVSLLLYTASEDAISKCDNLERTSAEYADCISKNMGTDKPK